MSSQNNKEEPTTAPGSGIIYRFSLIPKTEEDLKALKKDLLANERVGIRLYINIFLQNVLDYKAGFRKDLATLLIREGGKDVQS